VAVQFIPRLAVISWWCHRVFAAVQPRP
jgi:hypothetical protein